MHLNKVRKNSEHSENSAYNGGERENKSNNENL
jgi:hypothetical protein